MILELIGTIVVAIAPAIALQLREMMKKRKAERPLLEQGDFDEELLHDRPAVSLRLSRLHEAARERRAHT